MLSVANNSHRNRRHIYKKENAYLDRISQLMGTDRRTFTSYGKIKLWEDGENYQKVVKGDEEDLFHLSNRQLLWHGTKRTNIPLILKDGFSLPESKWQMFGAGIYFADRISKSSNYSDQDFTFLLLCEVGLGKQYSCKKPHNEWTTPPVGYDSVKGNGTYVPDWTDNGKYFGALIPFGKTAKCTKYENYAVNFNEFIVFDPKRIIIRFLVEVKVEEVFMSVSLSSMLVVPRDSNVKKKENPKVKPLNPTKPLAKQSNSGSKFIGSVGMSSLPSSTNYSQRPINTSIVGGGPPYNASATLVSQQSNHPKQPLSSIGNTSDSVLRMSQSTVPADYPSYMSTTYKPLPRLRPKKNKCVIL